MKKLGPREAEASAGCTNQASAPSAVLLPYPVFLNFCSVSLTGFKKDLAPWEGVMEALGPMELSWAEGTTLQQYCPPYASVFTPLCFTEDQQLSVSSDCPHPVSLSFLKCWHFPCHSPHVTWVGLLGTLAWGT